jgi:D-serine dehydratase
MDVDETRRHDMAARVDRGLAVDVHVARLLGSIDGDRSTFRFVHSGVRDADLEIGADLLTSSPTPVLAVKESALDFNVTRMAEFCSTAGVHLAPHVKTTMSPEIAARQLAAGAWGLTVANPTQATALLDVAPQRLVVANEVVDRAGILRLSTVPESIDVLVWADSVAAVERLDAGLTRDVDVLIELGVPGGRAGCRSEAAAMAVASAANRARHLRLVGVSSFEGVIGAGGRTVDAVVSVDRLLDSMHQLARGLVGHALVEASSVVLSAGGSVYFDRVVARLLKPVDGQAPTVVLRSGCYVTHDHGVYADQGPIVDRPLRPALELVATVLSTPEPGTAIVNFGRRDAPFDAGLPVPLWVGDADRRIATSPGSMWVDRLNDQHAWLRLAPHAERVAVGDTVGFGISHPCTAFDKWRHLPLIGDDYTIVDVITTRF